MQIKTRFALALAGFAGLALLSWVTLSNDPIPVFGVAIRLRIVTLLVLGMFAARTGLAFWRIRIEESREAGAEKAE